MPGLDLPASPPVGSTRSRDDARLRVVKFGDGYELRQPDGINHIREKLDLDWSAISEADKDTLLAFFRERAGHQQINYAGRKWVCKSWTRRPITGSLLWDFSVKLEEDFAP